MRIWRIENILHQGPYHTDTSQWMASHRRHDFSKMHPSPTPGATFVDRKLKRVYYDIYKYHFGFKSKKQLKQWFTKSERKRLKEIGYSIIALEVPKSQVIFGDKQVMFRYENIKKVA